MTRSLESYLQQYFHYNTFQQGQKEIISDVMAGKNVLGVLPTGSGKSLCYQLPAKILPGITIVVSPLISLMIDQVRQIKAYYYKEVAALHSFHQWHEKRRILDELHTYKLVFVSPELLQQRGMRERLNKLNLSLFVIDEAHCISQWGYDFRPDYLRLQEILKAYEHIPVLALTATASRIVQKDIIEVIQRKEMVKHTYSMERTNIAFHVEEIEGKETDKRARLKACLSQVEAPTIIYFSSRNMAEELATYLHGFFPDRNIAYYHAGMDNGERLKVQQQFIHDQLDIVCCTSAFGMGINKSNIRLVIHYHLPTQLESFVQEIGRAGRDGHESVSIVLYRKEDNQVPMAIIENELPSNAEIKFTCQQLQQLAIQGKPLPKTMNQMEMLFQINEVKWRFLLYQLEKRGIIKHHILCTRRETWQQAIKEISQFCETRLIAKRHKFQQIIQWIEGEACLRQTLYQSLQDEVEEITGHCCSNCQFSLDEWEYKETRKQSNPPVKNWQNKLQAILLTEDIAYESSGNH